jgi:hypothetical protein
MAVKQVVLGIGSPDTHVHDLVYAAGTSCSRWGILQPSVWMLPTTSTMKGLLWSYMTWLHRLLDCDHGLRLTAAGHSSRHGEHSSRYNTMR